MAGAVASGGAGGGGTATVGGGSGGASGTTVTIVSTSGNVTITAANDTHDERGRFGSKDGSSTSSDDVKTEPTDPVPDRPMIGGHPIVMSPEEADEWAKNSVIIGPLFHGTSNAAAESIRSEGFRSSGALLGSGVYVTDDQGYATSYARINDAQDAIETRVNVQNPIEYGSDEWKTLASELDSSSSVRIGDLAKERGYDAIRVSGEGHPAGELVVFDPANIVIVDLSRSASALVAASRPRRHRALKKTKQQELSDRAAAAMDEAVRELMRKVARRLEGPVTAAGGVTPDDLSIIRTLWPEIFDRLILPVLGDSWEEAAQVAARLMGVRLNRAVARYGEEAVLGVVNRSQQTFMEGARLKMMDLADAIEKLARAVLTEGFEAGESIPQLSRRLVDVVPDLALREATVIARTNVIGASNAGSLAQARAMGAEAVQLKTWIATSDERTRASHIQAEEDYEFGIPINEPFIVDGEAVDFPGDGSLAVSASCRCTVGYLDVAEGIATVPRPLDIEDVAASAVITAGNDEHDDLGRFGAKDGGGGGGSSEKPEKEPSEKPAWKPTMTRDEADAWASDSKIQAPQFHGTTDKAASDIGKDGFDLSSTGAYGSGIYLSDSHDTAFGYSEGVVVETRVNVENPIGQGEELDGVFNEVWASGVGPGESYAQAIQAKLEELGYDSITIAGDAQHETVVFDPRNVVVVGQEDTTIAAGNPHEHTGAMVALVPSEADCARLAIEGYEAPAEIHCTLLFLGEAADWEPWDQRLVHAVATELAAGTPVFEAQLMATSTFGPEDEPCAVYLLSNGRDGADELERVHDTLCHPLLTDKSPEQFSPWTPHVTIGYGLEPDALPLKGETIIIDRLRVSFAGETIDYPLGQALTAANDAHDSKVSKTVVRSGS